jgi:hypothetical protein
MEFVIKDMKNHKNKGSKCLNLTFNKEQDKIMWLKNQNTKTKTWDVQDKCENKYLLC